MADLIKRIGGESQELVITTILSLSAPIPVQIGFLTKPKKMTEVLKKTGKDLAKPDRIF